VKSGKWYFRQLHVNGERRRRGRLPQEGYYKVASSGDMINAQTSFVADNKWGFQFNPGEIDKNWRNLEDVEVVVLQFWTEARLRVDTIDVEQSCDEGDELIMLKVGKLNFIFLIKYQLTAKE